MTVLFSALLLILVMLVRFTINSGNRIQYFAPVENKYNILPHKDLVRCTNVALKDDEESDEWLDRSNAMKYSDYAKNNCPKSTGRPYFKKLIEEWVKIANKLRIRYFLSFGSLLGAWRDEDLIPYDLDTDAHFHIDDFTKLLPLRQLDMSSYNHSKIYLYITTDWEIPYKKRRRFNCKGKLIQKYEDECSITYPYARLIYGNYHLDLYVYTHYHKTVKFVVENEEYHKDDVLPTVKCNFMGIQTRCPRNPIALLEPKYGDLKPKVCNKDNKWV